MTGIERLRALAGAWDEWGLGGTLTEIADQIERELARHDEPDSTDKGARLLCVTDEDREAVEWVRNHGGLDHVRAEWRSRVPYDRYERRRQRLLGHIAECETALGRRNRRIEELGHRVNDLTSENAELRRRAMPDDYEWPRYTSGELVEVGDDVVDPDYGEWYKVASVEFHANGFTLHDKKGFSKWYESDERFEHTKPEPPDSWERIEDDATLSPEVYCHRNGIDISQKDGTEIFLADTVEPMARDLVRRCRALAERERGER